MRQSKDKVSAAIEKCYNNSSQSLNLTDSHLSAFQIILLLDRRDWTQLRQLRIDYNNLIDKECEMIALLGLVNLRTLRLYSNSIRQQGIHSLCKTQWPALNMLDIGLNPIRDWGLKELCNKEFKNLNILIITQCKITQQGIRNMVDSQKQWVHNLTQLNLTKNKLQSKGIKNLTKISMPNIKKLLLQQCNLEDEAFKHFSKACWPHLTILNLQKNASNPDGAERICTNNWVSISEIRITHFKCHNLHMVTSNWPKLSSGYSQLSNIFNKSIHKMSNIVFRDKFKIRLQ